jgi:transposase
MVQRVSVDNVSVTDASDEYGVSRPTSYQAKSNFDTRDCRIGSGKAGLPRNHKVDDEVPAFLQARLVPGEPFRARELAKLVRNELDLALHPRTIERLLKNDPLDVTTASACSSPTITEQYEALRSSWRSSTAQGS